ncbi:dethiobiotin synthase [Thiomicrorhabdus indica]|uniref:dethiobiotin synthase n=1 Tax=Thiomicrorhabdus indica TaxID=2267253 RepID=UPI002AA8EEC9|nr:dethiobiotin synthase [Thiomicrorhabdus indica]
MHHPISELKAGPHTGFFVTGTDTDVGKTFVAAKIAQQFAAQGLKISPRKPIASGCIVQADGSLLSEDALQLQQGAQSRESLEVICPYQFEPALSPQSALEMANVVVTIKDLFAACQTPDQNFALVEGAGGFLSPLCTDGQNRDLATALNLPVILIVADKLGCLNHALLSIEAIESAGLKLHAIVVNQVNPDSFGFAKDLEKWTETPIYSCEFDS